MTRHYPPLHPDEQEPIALNPLLRGVDLAIDRLIRRDCFTERTLAILDELREELVKVPRPLPDRDEIAEAIDDVIGYLDLNDVTRAEMDTAIEQAADAVLALLTGKDQQ